MNIWRELPMVRIHHKLSYSKLNEFIGSFQTLTFKSTFQETKFSQDLVLKIWNISKDGCREDISKLYIPVSNSNPLSWKVWQHPPAWSCCSSTRTFLPARASRAPTLSPPIPLPMMMVSRCSGTLWLLNPTKDFVLYSPKNCQLKAMTWNERIRCKTGTVITLCIL